MASTSNQSDVHYTGEEDLFWAAIDRLKGHQTAWLQTEHGLSMAIATALSKHYFACELCRIRKEGSDLLSYDLKRHVQTPDHWKKLQECGKTNVLFTISENDDFAVSTSLPVGIFTTLAKELQKLLYVPKYWCKLCPSEPPKESMSCVEAHRACDVHRSRKAEYDANRGAYLLTAAAQRQASDLDPKTKKFRNKGYYRAASYSPVPVRSPQGPSPSVVQIGTPPPSAVYYSASLASSVKGVPPPPLTPPSAFVNPPWTAPCAGEPQRYQNEASSVASRWAQYKRSSLSASNSPLKPEGSPPVKCPKYNLQSPQSSAPQYPVTQFLRTISLPPSNYVPPTLAETSPVIPSAAVTQPAVSLSEVLTASSKMTKCATPSSEVLTSSSSSAIVRTLAPSDGVSQSSSAMPSAVMPSEVVELSPSPIKRTVVSPSIVSSSSPSMKSVEVPLEVVSSAALTSSSLVTTTSSATAPSPMTPSKFMSSSSVDVSSSTEASLPASVTSSADTGCKPNTPSASSFTTSMSADPKLVTAPEGSSCNPISLDDASSPKPQSEAKVWEPDRISTVDLLSDSPPTTASKTSSNDSSNQTPSVSEESCCESVVECEPGGSAVACGKKLLNVPFSDRH